MPNKWSEQLSRDVAFARSVMLTQGEVQPMFVLHSATESKVIGAAWENIEDKRRVRAFVAMLALADNAEALSFMAEGWSINRPRLPGETEAAARKRFEGAVPSEAEDRVEILMVVNSYRDDAGERRTRGVMLEIIRDTEGKVTGLVERTPEGGDAELEGPLANLLPAREPPAIVREEAKRTLARIKQTASRETLH